MKKTLCAGRERERERESEIEKVKLIENLHKHI
jgi:hypothetical protein